MDFVKPRAEIIRRSMHHSECGCWKPYTNPLIGQLYWRRLVEVFNFLKSSRWNVILEIGCGYGYFLPSLCQISEIVIGSDIDTMFDFCKKVTLRYIQKSYGNLKLEKADVRRLSQCIKEDFCDVIVAISVLEHVDDVDNSVVEILKCLRPQGLFICVLPTENWLYKVGRKVLGYSGDYHRHFKFENVHYSLCKHFREVKMWHCPSGIPLFTIGVYKNE